MKNLAGFVVVVISYVLAHGLTSLLIVPLQSVILPNVTAFASLMYLPHGVRVLATWLMGPRAFFPLLAGAFLSELFFTPAPVASVTDPVLLLSMILGAAVAPLSFEVFRRLGRSFYAGQNRRVHWSSLLLVGLLASLLNSLGQSLVFSSLISPGHLLAVIVTYSLGDTVGLVVTALTLMLVFRWFRVSGR